MYHGKKGDTVLIQETDNFKVADGTSASIHFRVKYLNSRLPVSRVSAIAGFIPATGKSKKPLKLKWLLLICLAIKRRWRRSFSLYGEVN